MYDDWKSTDRSEADYDPPDVIFTDANGDAFEAADLEGFPPFPETCDCGARAWAVHPSENGWACIRCYSECRACGAEKDAGMLLCETCREED